MNLSASLTDCLLQGGDEGKWNDCGPEYLALNRCEYENFCLRQLQVSAKSEL